MVGCPRGEEGVALTKGVCEGNTSLRLKLRLEDDLAEN